MSRTATARVLPYRKIAKKSPVLKEAKHKKPDPISDDIFFHKGQLKKGTKLVCYGRLDPLSQWHVAAINTHVLGKKVSDGWKWIDSEEVQFLSDRIFLENRATGQNRMTTFASMSYSAIWRLA